MLSIITVHGGSLGKALGTLLSFAELRLFGVAFPLADNAVGLGTGHAIDGFILWRLRSRWRLGFTRNLDFLVQRDGLLFWFWLGSEALSSAYGLQSGKSVNG